MATSTGYMAGCPLGKAGSNFVLSFSPWWTRAWLCPVWVTRADLTCVGGRRLLQRCVPQWGGEGGTFLSSSSRFVVGPELGDCSVGGGREPVLESGSPVTVTYFPAGVNSLLVWPVPPLHGNCREQPALGHLSRQEALESQSACQVSNPGELCAAKWARAQGWGGAGHGGPAGSEGLWQSSDLEPHLSILRPWGCAGAVG